MTSGKPRLALGLLLACLAVRAQGQETVYLAIEGKDGAMREEAFPYARVRPGKQ
jgi:hypothetical protein